MNKYDKSKIARIIFADGNEYILGTVQRLKDTLAGSKRSPRTINRFFKGKSMVWADARIVLIEKYSCKDKEELTSRVEYWRGEEDYGRFKKGKIYKLTWEGTDKIYVGHTTDSLRKRLYGHKRSPNSLNKDMGDEFGWDNCSISLLVDYPCRNKRELEIREQYYMDMYKPALNINRSCKNGEKTVCGKEQEKLYFERDHPYCSVCDERFTRQGIVLHYNSEEHLFAFFAEPFVQEIYSWRKERMDKVYMNAETYRTWVWESSEDPGTPIPFKFDETGMIMVVDYDGKECNIDMSSYEVYTTKKL